MKIKMAIAAIIVFGIIMVYILSFIVGFLFYDIERVVIYSIKNDDEKLEAYAVITFGLDSVRKVQGWHFLNLVYRPILFLLKEEPKNKTEALQFYQSLIEKVLNQEKILRNEIDISKVIVSEYEDRDKIGIFIKIAPDKYLNYNYSKTSKILNKGSF